MRNVDKYLIETLDKNLCPHIYYLRTNELCPKGEDNSVCQDCHKINQEWLAAEYIAPEIDWSKVEQGTDVYSFEGVWLGRFIAYYKAKKRIVVDTSSSIKYCVASSYATEDCGLEK